MGAWVSRVRRSFQRGTNRRNLQVRRLANGKANVQETAAKKIATDKNADDCQIFPGDVIMAKAIIAWER